MCTATVEKKLKLLVYSKLVYSNNITGLSKTKSKKSNLLSRMGHTWIHPSLNGTDGFPLRNEFFNSRLIHQHGSDLFIKNMARASCADTDR